MVRKKSRLTARKHSSRGQALVRAQVPRCVQGGYSGPWHKYGKVADPKQRMSVTHRTQQERRAADHITTMYGKQQEADPASTMPRPVEAGGGADSRSNWRRQPIPEATWGMYAVAINLGSADSPPLEAQAKEVVKKSGINANVRYCLLSGVCLCCRGEKSSAVVICTEDELLHSPSRSLHDKVDDRQQAHPVLLSTTLCQRKPPVVLRRPEAASHHSLATVAPSGGAGENGAATRMTATQRPTTIITIITATTNATLIP